MERSIFIDREDVKRVEEEESSLFLREFLEKMEIPLGECWPELELTLDQKVKLRDLLSKLDIDIIYDGDRGYEVYLGNQLVAQWFKPRVLLRRDFGIKNQSKQLYYQINLKGWSVFEDMEKENEG
jgi:hypothetical protein